MSEAFDPWKHAKDTLASLPQQSGPQLSFHQRCAIFAAFKLGYRAPTIATAFNVSRQTANHIAGCTVADSPRYRDVAAEFNALGERPFIDRYYTQDIGDKVDRAKRARLRKVDESSVKGPDYTKTEKSSRRINVISTAPDRHWWIAWTQGDGHPNGEGGPGWRFTHCNKDGSLPDDYFYQGAEATMSNPYGELKPHGYRTSGLAFKAVWEIG